MTRKKLAPKQPKSTGKARRAAKNKHAGIPLDAMLREKLGSLNKTAAGRLDQPVPFVPAEPFEGRAEPAFPSMTGGDLLALTGDNFTNGRNSPFDERQLCLSTMHAVSQDLAVLTYAANHGETPGDDLGMMLFRLHLKLDAVIGIVTRQRVGGAS
jgi:hypothetical protein